MTLSAEERAVVGRNLSSIRKSGRIPAVLYGRKISSRHLSVSFLEFSRLYKSAGENTIIELLFPKEKPINTLIYDVSLDPVSGRFIHVDFYQVRMDEKVEAKIPLVFVGESVAVRGLGGVLVKTLDEIEVSCLPSNIPHELSIDISALASFDDQIHVSDVSVPEGVKILSDVDTVVAFVEPPRSDEEIAELESKVEADVTKVVGVVKETSPATEKKEK